MKKKQKEQQTRTKCAYLPPRTDIFPIESVDLMAGTSGESGGGAGQAGQDPDIDDDDNPGGGGTNFGGGAAKILGREFSFSDIWED